MNASFLYGATAKPVNVIRHWPVARIPRRSVFPPAGSDRCRRVPAAPPRPSFSHFGAASSGPGRRRLRWTWLHAGLGLLVISLSPGAGPIAPAPARGGTIDHTVATPSISPSKYKFLARFRCETVARLMGKPGRAAAPIGGWRNGELKAAARTIRDSSGVRQLCSVNASQRSFKMNRGKSPVCRIFACG